MEKYHGTETFLTEALTLEAKKHVADAAKWKSLRYIFLIESRSLGGRPASETVIAFIS